MAKFELDTEFIRQLAAVLEETNLGEIELSDGDRRIRIARPSVTLAAAGAPLALPHAAVPSVAAAALAPVPAAVDAARHPGAVKSPMVGTAYLAPEPGKPAFVAIGDKVSAGQTLLIIEAMKTYNPIKAPKSGTVLQILTENAQPVEFGQTLMIVE